MPPVFNNATNQIAALKELYDNPTEYMKDLVYKKNPMLAIIPKDESPQGFAGKYIPVPLIYGTPQGRSATFANAQLNQTPTQMQSFFVFRVSNYVIASISNELLEAATGQNAGAFLDEGKLQVDASFRSISNDLAGDLFRSGTGTRGQIGTYALVGTVITIVLLDTNDIVQFEVGMTLVATATDGGVPSATTAQVTNVNRSTGQLILLSSSATPSAQWAALSFLVAQGDIGAAGASGTTSFLKVAGLAAWLPFIAPVTGDSFWGVDRSVDVTRLAGVRFDGSGESIEEALIDGSSLVAREGGAPEMCFMNFASYSALEKELGSKVQYVDVRGDDGEGGMGDIAFKGITVHAPYGPITVIPDRNCPQQMCYLLELDVWKLRSLGKAPHILTYGMEGLEGLRVGTADALEIRIGYYANLITSAPGWNCVIRLSA